MNKALKEFFSKQRNVYFFGLLIAIIATSLEVARGRAENFYTFYYSTIAFWGTDLQTISQWGGGNPYSEGYCSMFRSFLYTPVFSFFFTPFTWLPMKVAAFVWNILHYSLFFVAIMMLPAKLFEKSNMPTVNISTERIKAFMFLLLLLEASVFPFQYNIAMAYLFVFAYILLEKDKPVWAVMLIMLSATTKIYGIFQLGLLFCYKKTWRNLGLAVLFGIGFALLPAFSTGIDGLIPYYGDWVGAITKHNYHDFTPTSFIAVRPFREFFMEYRFWLQVPSLAVLAVLFFMKHKCWYNFKFRTQVLGLLMAWICIFGDATEAHTYIIAFTGYMLWYSTQEVHTRLDKTLYWVNWFLFSVTPVDILFPPSVYWFIDDTLTLDIYILTFTWIRQVYLLYSSCKTLEKK